MRCSETPCHRSRAAADGPARRSGRSNIMTPDPHASSQPIGGFLLPCGPGGSPGRLPPELATSAILARYAAVLADTPSNVLWSDSEVWGSGRSDLLLLGVVGRGVGYPDGGSEFCSLPCRFNGQAELRLIWYIMDCAFWAHDLPVVHQCIDIIASWM